MRRPLHAVRDDHRRARAAAHDELAIVTGHLATLYLSLAADDHAGHRVILRQVIEADVFEPFTASLLLAAAVTQHEPAAGQPGTPRWTAAWAVRRFSHQLLDISASPHTDHDRRHRSTSSRHHDGQIRR